MNPARLDPSAIHAVPAFQHRLIVVDRKWLPMFGPHPPSRPGAMMVLAAPRGSGAKIVVLMQSYFNFHRF